MGRRLWPVLAGLLLPLSLATAADGELLKNGLDFEPCTLSGSAGNGNLNAECATWRQPLNRDQPQGEQITLFVARLPSTALESSEDAFTVINGGPGGSSIDLLVDFAQVLRPFTRKRDVIVIDQRGTGRSAPLTCEALTDAAEVPDADGTVALTRECLQSLPHDPRFFSTSVAVQDLEALRQTLGYRQLSLYGVSYGTRVAMQYMRTHAAQTRAVVIDGVVPPQRVLGGSIALHSQNSLQTVFDRCATDTQCAAAFPNLDREFTELSTRLKARPVPMQLPDPVSGKNTELQLTYGHLAVWLRFALYSPEMTGLIPLTIHQAAALENYLPIAANALRLMHDLTTTLNYGMHNAVVCTEDTPFFATEAVDYDALDRTYLGRDMYDTLNAMCSTWPQGVLDETMKEPLTSAVPTLVLSGEFDPITPPDWGDQVLTGLSQAKHLVAPGQGHGVIARGCIPRLVLDFVESADINQVDDTCIGHLSPYPFFVDLMGPPP